MRNRIRICIRIGGGGGVGEGFGHSPQVDSCWHANTRKGGMIWEKTSGHSPISGVAGGPPGVAGCLAHSRRFNRGQPFGNHGHAPRIHGLLQCAGGKGCPGSGPGCHQTGWRVRVTRSGNGDATVEWTFSQRKRRLGLNKRHTTRTTCSCTNQRIFGRSSRECT